MGSKIKNVEKANIKLSPIKKCGYAIGDFGNNFSWSFVSSFLMYFWTENLGISAATAGVVIGLSRVWDAINDPLIGRWADHTKSKWGHYRPWIIWFTIPLGIFNILCFTNFRFENPTTTVAVAALSFFVLVFLYTCVNVPYSAMEASLTLDAKERGSLATYRLLFAYSAGLIIAYGTQRFISGFGGGDSTRGYFMTAVMYTVVMLITHLICFANVQEVVEVPVEKIPYKESFKALKGNGPVLILCVGFLVYGLFGYGRSAVALYFFQFCMNNPLYFATYSLLYMGGSMVGIFIAPFVSKNMKNKASIVTLGFGLTGIFAIACFLTGNIAVIYMLSTLLGIGCGMATTMLYGMVPDTTEYTQARYGVRAAGFISAVVNFCLKVGMAIGTSGAGIIMGMLGYVSQNAQQSSSVQLGIRLMFTIVPGVLAIICAALMKLYKLDFETYNKILEELSDQEGEDV